MIKSQYLIQRYQNAILQEFWPDAMPLSKCSDGLSFPAVKQYLLPERLYHYTSLGTSIAILGDANDGCGFAFTHYEFLNDRAEFTLGRDIALKWIEKRGGEKFYWCNKDNKLATHILKQQKEQSCVPYVLSFTTEKDSLPQWMSYSDKHSGGLAIGCRRKNIESVISNINYESLADAHLSDVIFAPCIYCDGTDDQYLRCENILDAMFSGCEYSWREESREEFIRWVAARLFQFAALVKSSEFRHEQEWRLVLRPKNVDYASGIQFISGKPRLKPGFVDLKSCVDCLMVSPHGDRQKNGIVAKLLAAKLPRKVTTKMSGLSYCGE